MKTLITHIRPHLDDICAMWLLKRYLPEAKDAALDFIATNEKGGDVVDNPDFVYVGVGRGQFDEHKGDIGDCATTLVFKYVVVHAQIDLLEKRALDKIVAWAFQEDTGRLATIPYRAFAVPAIIEGYFDGHDRSSHAVTEFGFAMLDALIVVQRNDVRLDDDWGKRVEFPSRWGKAVAVSSFVRQIDSFAYAQGYPLIVIVNPDRTYHSVRASAMSDVDLSDAYAKLKEIDPGASWYFHHSKKMLICGGDHAPQATPSKLTVEQLMDLLK